MIDEGKTFNKFGYYSWQLTKSSKKKIVVICDECGKERKQFLEFMGVV